MEELYCPVCGDYLSKTVEWDEDGYLLVDIFCENCGEFDMTIHIDLKQSEFRRLKEGDKIERKAILKVIEYGELE